MNTHQALLELEKAFGYTVHNTNGFCYGVSMKWLEATLLGASDIQRFAERIEIVCATSPKKLIEQINAVKEKIKFKKIVTDEEQTLLEIPALLDSIQIYQAPFEHLVIFNKQIKISQRDIEQSSYLASSRDIEKYHGISIVHSDSMIINQETLITYFQEIQSIFDQEKTNASIILKKLGHAVALHYNHPQQEWVLMDINEWPEKTTSDIHVIIDHLSSLIGENNPFSFSLIRLRDHQMSVTMENQLKQLKQKNIAKLNPETAKRIGNSGVNCLFTAAKDGDRNMLIALLTHGANPNQATTDHGNTPLMVAALNENLDIVNTLLMHGANPNQAVTDNGNTPLFLSIINGHLDIVKSLLSHGANPNQATTDDGVPPLYIAIVTGHLEIVNALLMHGANPNRSTTDNGPTPLCIAAEVGHLEIVKTLLTYGADSNQTTTDDVTTPLYIAALSGHMEIVKVLLAHEVELMQKNNPAQSSYNWSFDVNASDLQNKMGVIKSIFENYKRSATIDAAKEKGLITPLISDPNNLPVLQTLLSEKLLPPSLISKGLEISLVQGESAIAKLFYEQLEVNHKIREPAQKIIAIFDQIEKLRAYAERVQQIDRKLSGWDPKELTNKLKKATQQFIEYDIFSNPTDPIKAENAKNQFNEAFNETYNLMKTHRKLWKLILVNLAIAATGVGLLPLGVKLALTGKGFFSETNRQKQVQTIRDNIEKLNASPKNTSM